MRGMRGIGTRHKKEGTRMRGIKMRGVNERTENEGMRMTGGIRMGKAGTASHQRHFGV